MRLRPLIPLIAAASLLSGTAFASGDDAPAAASVAGPLAPTSLYQLTAPWQRESGQTVALADWRGRPVVLVFFYGSCRHACPTIMRDLRRLEAALSDAARAETAFLLVTIDPARDTVDALAAMAAQYELDGARWALLRGDIAQIRELSAVVGVQFRGSADGEIQHTNMITVLDAEGTVVHQVEGLNQPTPPIAAAVQALVDAP